MGSTATKTGSSLTNASGASPTPRPANVAMRSTAWGRSNQTSQSFRSWLTLAQQRSLPGMSDRDSPSSSGFSSLGLSSSLIQTPFGLTAGSDLGLFALTGGLGQSSCPFCGRAAPAQSLLPPSVMQAIQAAARDAVLQTLSQVAGWGTAPIVDGRSIPLTSGSTTPILPAAPSAATPAAAPAVPGIGSTGGPSPVTSLPANSVAMAIGDFPKPPGDNGRGMHWIPTMYSSPDVVDRYVKEAKDMHVKWMVFLNDGTKIGENDYLVKKLVENGIMPVMRVYTPNGKPIEGDVGALVRHYKALGVDYYQLYNEPNLNVENPEGQPDVNRYVDKWVKAAREVTAAGGLPGFGALSPGGNFDDLEFLKQSLDRIKKTGNVDVLDHAWLSMHNYTLNHPLDYSKDSNGFLKFKWYDQVVREKLGRSMPIIGTEGGTFVGSAEDHNFSAVSEQQQIQMVTEAFRYMKNREPYNFAYSYWVIANEAGGGGDPSFSQQALFKPGGASPLVDALKRLGD